MKYTNNGGEHVDTEGHSVFHILPPDVDPPENINEPIDWFDTVLGALQWFCTVLAVFSIGGLVAGLVYQLIVGGK